MIHRKIDPIQVRDEFPQSLREQVLNFNKLLIQDEFHRTSDLSDEEMLKFIDARSKLLKAKAVLLDALVEFHQKRAAEMKNEYWRKVVKSTLTVGASTTYLVWQLWNLGWGVPAIAAFLVSMTLVIVALIHWIVNH